MEPLGKLLPTVAALTICAQANAEVIGAAAHGFRIEIKAQISTAPDHLYRSLVKDIDKWWDKSHTYSGNSANLYIEAKPKGWFGERLADDGFVRHMEVVYAAPGKSIRMLGGLGPLQELGVHAALTIKLQKTIDNKTSLQLIYVVAGFEPSGLENLAKPVDQVLSNQVRRLKSFAEGLTP